MLLWMLGCMYLFKLVFSFSLDIYPGVVLLDHMVVLFFVSWRNSILFSIVAAPIYIPTDSVRGFPFLHILTIYCLWIFKNWSIVNLQCCVSFRCTAQWFNYMCVCVCVCVCACVLFQILFPYGLLQSIPYSFVCYTAGPCWLSVLYIVVLVDFLMMPILTSVRWSLIEVLIFISWWLVIIR